MTVEELKQYTIGISIVVVVITVTAFIIFSRWGRRDRPDYEKDSKDREKKSQR